MALAIRRVVPSLPQAIIPFKDENDAVFQGNDTIYGLAASVWTRELSRAHRVAHAIKAGTVLINCQSGSDVLASFGGYEQSGSAAN